MSAVTLSTLVARVRDKADMPTAGFVADSSTGLYAYINEGVQLLHDKLCRAYAEDYMEKPSAFTYTSGDVSLPADFYKLLGVDLLQNGTTVTLSAYTRRERNALSNTSLLGYGGVPRYKLTSVGGIAGTGAIRLLPAPTSGTTGTIWYIPTPPVLTVVGDTVNFPGGWERYVVTYAAIQCLLKEESDVNDLRVELSRMDAELNDIIENRDAGEPKHSGDVDNLNDSIYW